MIFLEYWKELCFRSEKYIFFYRIVKYRTRNIDRETIKSIEFDQSDSLLLPYSLYVKEKRKKKERNTFIRYRDTFNSIKVSHNNHLINISKINSELIHILRILKRNRIFIYFCEIVFFFFPIKRSFIIWNNTYGLFTIFSNFIHYASHEHAH